MDALFWSRMHGGVTHFPIAMIFGAALFDGLACLLRKTRHLADQFRIVGYWMMLLAALASFAAVFSGLALSHWQTGGTGPLARHHLFVWPAFALLVALATWRALVRPDAAGRAFALYLLATAAGCAFVATAGYFGGEMLLGR